MSAPATPAGAAHSAPAPQTGSGKRLVGRILMGVIVLILVVKYHGNIRTFFNPPPPQTDNTNTAPATQAAPPPQPSVYYETTPAVLSLDFGYNIEADSPILVKYPGEKAVLYTPGRKCMPTPKYSGDKVFTDPDDPNGQKPFRIYRAQPGDPRRCP